METYVKCLNVTFIYWKTF